MDNFIENLRERDFSQIANLLDTAIARYPERSVDLLALAYTLSQEMPVKQDIICINVVFLIFLSKILTRFLILEVAISLFR